MRVVELTTAEQLDIQSLHRARSRLVGTRTTLTNQLHAILLERGTTIAQGRRKLKQGGIARRSGLHGRPHPPPAWGDAGGMA